VQTTSDIVCHLQQSEWHQDSFGRKDGHKGQGASDQHVGRGKEAKHLHACPMCDLDLLLCRLSVSSFVSNYASVTLHMYKHCYKACAI